MTKRVLGISFLWVVCAFLASPSLAAESPQQDIKAAVDKGIQVLSDPALKGSEKEKERIEKLRGIVFPLFDFPEMAKRSLGSHWRRRDAQQREEFVKLFTDLLERTYAKQISAYDGEQVVYTGEKVDGRYAQVDSKIVDKRGREFEVDYRMWRPQGRWKIYDVVIENISLVNNYRAQFNRVISKSSFEELMEKMRGKSS